MCGIAIVADFGADGAASLDTLGAMHADLAGRGPDGEGWLLIDGGLVPHRYEHRPGTADLPKSPLRVAAAFRRLAVRDLRQVAAQPLARRAGTLWICHNGEIYNDAEVRRDLEARGTVFATENDAETILAAYETWGDSCFELLRGMWAVVIVDLVQGRLVMCRDRLGIKPLFHAKEGTRTLIASHARTIARVLGGGPKIEPSRWHRFLRGFPADSAGGSFFANVEAVPAGTLISIELRTSDHPRPHFRRYWSLQGQLPNPHDVRDPQDVENELFALLEASTREHLVADRPVGCLLSGGLDSSLVACLAAREARATGRTPTCFSIVYDDPRMSEWPYIQTVAAHAGIRSVTHQLTAAETWGLVDDVVSAQGEPLLGQDVIAQYRAFRLARDHGCVVALEGQAADELFAGLPSYEAVMFRQWLGEGAWGRILSEARLRGTAQQKAMGLVLKQYLFGPMLRGWVDTFHRPTWLSAPEPAKGIAPPAGLAVECSSDPSRLNRHLFDLVRHTNLPAVLSLQYRNAMAHGVENRPPFLDHRLVEWAFRLPAAAKVGGGRRKRVLWGAGRRLLPASVLARTDKRAIVSSRDWMPLRTTYRDNLLAMAEAPRLRSAPYVRGDRMARFVRAYLRGEHDDGPSVWRLYTGWRWLEQFKPTS